MGEIFLHYEISPTTWFYLSSLMIVGIFFKFYRVLSVRNLDILALLCFGPGMLLLMFGYSQAGYIIMFSFSLFYTIRLLLDNLMVRRPMLEPNLDSDGMVFTCLSLLLFLAGSIAISVCPLEIRDNSLLMDKKPMTLENALRIDQLQRTSDPMLDFTQRGPGYPWFHEFALTPLASNVVPDSDKSDAPQNPPDKNKEEIAGNSAANPQSPSEKTLSEKESSVKKAETNSAISGDTTVTALNINESQIYWTKLLAIGGHLLIALGIIAVGYFHFGNFNTGVAAATLYLMLPYTYQFPTRLDHIIPAIFLVWAMVFYRRPWVSGCLIGIAASLVYYPWFLLPLWIGFYWRRGVARFTISAVSTMLIMGFSIFVFSENQTICQDNIINMMGCVGMLFKHPQGFWDVAVSDMAYRIPVLAAYVGLCISLVFWPSQKNLGILLSCSAAVMLAAQLCHPYQGGLYMAWYLPFLILTIFRPNLEDRVATTSVYESRFRIIPRQTT